MGTYRTDNHTTIELSRLNEKKSFYVNLPTTKTILALFVPIDVVFQLNLITYRCVIYAYVVAIVLDLIGYLDLV